MRRIIQISGWLLFIMGLIIIMLFSGNEYQWMQDMDPSMTTLPQGNGNREIIKMLIYHFVFVGLMKIGLEIGMAVTKK